MSEMAFAVDGAKTFRVSEATPCEREKENKKNYGLQKIPLIDLKEDA